MKLTSPNFMRGAQPLIPEPPIEMQFESVVRQWTGIIFRRRKLFLGVLTTVLLIAFAYISIAPRLYTATVSLLIDVRQNEMMKDRQNDSSPMVASSDVDNQVEILKSPRIALAVIHKLDLLKNEEFGGGGPTFSPISWVRWLFAGSQEENGIERNAVEQFGRKLTIERVNLTYMVKIHFVAREPKLAAQIANAVADAYLTDQLEARYDVAQRARTWLNERIQTLRQRQIDSERAVAEFRVQNNIVDIGGKTAGDQQLGELNSRLTLARTQSAEAFAKWRQIQHVVGAGDIDAPGLTDAAGNPVIQKMHDQLGDLVRQKADVVSRVGADHAAAVRLGNEINEVRKLILSELRTVEGSVRNEYEIAKNREDALAKEVKNAIGENNVTDRSQIQLRDLQRDADANKTLYEAFLGRYVIASEQQSFPISEGRIVNEATPPLGPSDPKVMVILALALAGGTMLGFGAAVARDRLEQGFRSRRQVRDELGTSLLAVLPRVDPDQARGTKSSRLGLRKTNVPEDLPEARQILRVNRVMRVAVESVLSRFTDALRSVRISIERNVPAKNGRVIGIISSVSNEGKSTFSANFAQLLADSGERVLLIDADFRRASLTGELAPLGALGAAEVVMGLIPLSATVLYDAQTGLEFLGGGDRCSAAEATELANSRVFAQFIEQQRATYTWTILDLPPLIPVVDAHTVIDVVDGFVMLIEWGATARTVVVQALEGNEVVHAKLFGCVFNKVDVNLMAEYEPHMKTRYYSAYYDEVPKTAEPGNLK